MVSVSKKALSALRTSAGRLWAVAALCMAVVLIVLRATSMMALEEPGPVYHGLILAFDAEDISDLEGMLESDEDPAEEASETNEASVEETPRGSGQAASEALNSDGPITFPVTLVVGDDTNAVMVSAGTVSEVLKRAGIPLGIHDLVSPDLDHEVQEFDRIVVTRREQVVYTDQHEVPYKTYYYYSPDVKPGTEVVAVEGENGLYVDTYSQYLVKGEVVEEALISQDVLKEPVHKEIQIGFKTMPVSSFDFEWGFDNSGEPADYVKVVRGGKSTAYYAPAGSSTSTGRPAMVGHVAVNPNVIPYGSKLFIQSSDGNYIYGYAIAADTGGTLMRGTVAVDLYYDTYEECVRHGARTVDIFVLE